jgi:hypothetical protein
MNDIFKENIDLDEENKKNINDKLIKSLKFYLLGKKNIEKNKNKSFEYFKQTLNIINELKNVPLKEKYINIIDETETECSKFFYESIEYSIDNNEELNNCNENLFNMIEEGIFLDINKYKYNEINFKIYNENGLSPLHYAIKFGDTNFLKNSFILGANIDEITYYGHTLLEYACLEKDPNIITFLTIYGADMKKHLEFRNGKLYNNKGYNIDILLIIKLILNNNNNNNILLHLDFIFKYINPDLKLNIEYNKPTNVEIYFKDLIYKLDFLLNNLNEDSRITYINILKEELEYELKNKLSCPSNKLEILLYNLMPFINISNVKLNWLISLEVKYIMLKILKTYKININKFKSELNNYLYNTYIKTDILPEGLLETIILQWIYKIKV